MNQIGHKNCMFFVVCTLLTENRIIATNDADYSNNGHFVADYSISEIWEEKTW